MVVPATGTSPLAPSLLVPGTAKGPIRTTSPGARYPRKSDVVVAFVSPRRILIVPGSNVSTDTSLLTVTPPMFESASNSLFRWILEISYCKTDVAALPICSENVPFIVLDPFVVS